jgi:23S rRNA (cytosine1962-C5)-methyltransferase
VRRDCWHDGSEELLFCMHQTYGSFCTSPASWRRFEGEHTNAFRTHTLPGGWSERLGDDLLLSYKEPATLQRLRELCMMLPEEVGFTPRRLFGRHLPVRNQERVSPVLLEGDPELPLSGVVLEAGAQFGVDFSAGYSTGLFLDQRRNRALVRQAEGGRMLNTFAYTCSFSVCAALAGAQTLSVDLSRKSLSRGEASFLLNGLNPATHRFLAADVREALPRLARKGERFDTIILDPPTFSTSATKGRFRVEDDLEHLVQSVLDLAAPRAQILVSTNCTRLSTRDLERMSRLALKSRRMGGEIHPTSPPEDFPPGTAATCVWIKLSG